MRPVMSGLGVGIHKFPDGNVKAVCLASRSLTVAEQKYNQIEKKPLPYFCRYKVSQNDFWKEVHRSQTVSYNFWFKKRYSLIYSQSLIEMGPYTVIV